MRLHLPITLLAAVLACYTSVSLAVPTSESPAWGANSTFNNNEPANEYSVTGSQSVNLDVNSGKNNYSTGLYIGAGSSFTINQNTERRLYHQFERGICRRRKFDAGSG